MKGDSGRSRDPTSRSTGSRSSSRLNEGRLPGEPRLHPDIVHGDRADASMKGASRKSRDQWGCVSRSRCSGSLNKGRLPEEPRPVAHGHARGGRGASMKGGARRSREWRLDKSQVNNGQPR